MHLLWGFFDPGELRQTDLVRSWDRTSSRLVRHVRSLGNSALQHSPLLPPHLLLPYAHNSNKQAVSIHRAAEKGYSRKLGFRRRLSQE